MEKRRLGNSDMDITRLGIGAWAIGGGGWAFAWGPQDDKDSIRAIREGLDAGMNWIDTAAVYGLGHSEEVVAQALEGVANRPYVFTKCARAWNEKREIVKCLKRESIRRECEASLRRLKVDVIDLYQIHWPEPDEDVEEGWSTMADLQREGKVRWIGLSNFNADQMKRAWAIAPITSLQPPYTLVVRGIEPEVLPYCQEHNIGVISYAPMRSGLLSGKMTRERIRNLPADDWRWRNPDFQEPKLSLHLRLVDLLRQIGNKYGHGPGEVAIAWTLRNPAVTAAIVGVRAPGQATELAGAAQLRLSDEDASELQHFLERQEAPVR
jgi:aryl-alcohol dehydrogenase-like predicted oxidoreductase